MIDLEIPLGKRTPKYRFFEMIPAILSYGSIILLIVLSIMSPLFASAYLIIVVTSMIVKAVGIAIHTIEGRNRLEEAAKTDWHTRLDDLEQPKKAYERLMTANSRRNSFRLDIHKNNLLSIIAEPSRFPKPSGTYNAVIIAAYNELYEVLKPTIQSVIDTIYDNKKIILVLAYEERGGEDIERTVQRLKKKFDNRFYALHLVKHPQNLPNEVIGKGGNITHAGRFLKEWLPTVGIDYKNVLITTLDSDNRPHKAYFDYVMYEYIVHEDRKQLAYQPIALFFNNIWDAPAPMRVIATGNSFWNLISSMRPHILRNFAAHAQPMDALVEMDFWSTRTIVEDGHQYWRSYFYFNGNYSVIPIYVPIYQDAVMSDTYLKTLKAQFVQLRRWQYGASDIPYVANRIFSCQRNVPFINGIASLVRLIDSHITLATVSLLIAFGGWTPLIINSEASRNIAAHNLPEVVSLIQQVALVGLFVTIFLSFKILPPRPARYKRTRSFGMLLQWALMPVTAVVYSSASAFYSQTRLFLGKYLDKFDVTDKATYVSIIRARKNRLKHRKLKITKQA
jgi:cellulose synthase/poly-beta-1,6-N-acetylglucosamine synthase-like glycosyltransferase